MTPSEPDRPHFPDDDVTPPDETTAVPLDDIHILPRIDSREIPIVVEGTINAVTPTPLGMLTPEQVEELRQAALRRATRWHACSTDPDGTVRESKP